MSRKNNKILIENEYKLQIISMLKNIEKMLKSSCFLAKCVKKGANNAVFQTQVNVLLNTNH